MAKINEVMTASEAAERWGLNLATVKLACSGQKGGSPRFHTDEFRKSKGTWLVTIEGMERVYGKEPK